MVFKAVFDSRPCFMEQYELKFEWNLTVTAENLKEAKQVAPNVLREHLTQVNLKERDFTKVED